MHSVHVKIYLELVCWLSKLNFMNIIKITIFGSCVSRDIFEYESTSSKQFVVDRYFARSSFASAFSSLKVVNASAEMLKSSFQKETVRCDLEKYFCQYLNNFQSDVLLIDLIDERFDIFLFHDGTICTLSDELLRGGFVATQNLGRVVVSGSAEFIDLWSCGWKRFIELVQNNNLLDKIRINKVFWSEGKEDGSFFEAQGWIGRANGLLNILYKRMESDIPREQFFEFDKSIFVGAINHKWGVNPYHYIDSYYLSALSKLALILGCGESAAVAAHGEAVTPLQDRFVFNLSSVRIGDELIFSVNHSEFGDFRFAFYVYKNNEKIAVQWYSESNVCRVLVEGVGEYLVHYFVVDAGVVEYGAENRDRKINGLFDLILIA